MKLRVQETHEVMSRNVSDLVIDILEKNRNALFCFAAGETPLVVFNNLVTASRNNIINFDHARFVGLDEWVGLNENDFGSCRHTLNMHFFHPLEISSSQIHFFDGRKNQKEECKKVNAFLSSEGPIDLAILGIGLNGHVGFNEPGSALDSLARIVELQPETIEAGKKYFNKEQKLNEGVTLGMKHLLAADNIILMASGEKKAEIIQKIFESPSTSLMPVTFFKDHPQCQLFVDKKAHI